ncbi:hypothetical protein KSS87_008249 [Heliosperma pusillum]|nr:hypothetical protein KSS87_008249 [Heliosperma pusillum]
MEKLFYITLIKSSSVRSRYSLPVADPGISKRRGTISFFVDFSA